MSINKSSGKKKFSKVATGGDVPYYAGLPTGGDETNRLNIQQLASDIYTVAVLNGDGLPILARPLQSILPPVGSIIPHYDFSGTVTPDPTTWKYCDGSLISDVGSPLNGMTIPDLSNRYLVGFGAEGAGDIGTAAWATAPVGIASHTININHRHYITDHDHTMQSHTHPIATHNHRWCIYDDTTKTDDLYTWDSGGTQHADYITDYQQISGTTASGEYLGFASGVYGSGTSIAMYTDKGGPTGTSGPSTANTSTKTNLYSDYQLSSSQSIQPRSIRVRFIMRIK